MQNNLKSLLCVKTFSQLAPSYAKMNNTVFFLAGQKERQLTVTGLKGAYLSLGLPVAMSTISHCCQGCDV